MTEDDLNNDLKEVIRDTMQLHNVPSSRFDEIYQMALDYHALVANDR